MLQRLYPNMKSFKRVRRSINRAFQGLNQKGQSLLQDLENHKLEKLYCITKMQRHFLSTKSTLLKIPICKKAFFTQCQRRGKTFERNKLETLWWVELCLKGKHLMLEILRISWFNTKTLKSAFKRFETKIKIEIQIHHGVLSTKTKWVLHVRSQLLALQTPKNI